MNYDPDDVLFGVGDGNEYFCPSPSGDAGYSDAFRHDSMEVFGDDLTGYEDNSLAIPMEDLHQSYDLQSDSRDFQTLQPPVSSAYDMDMAHSSQSSMGMGYSNGGTNDALHYEKATPMTNGDHHMLGANDDHYGMQASTSFGSYHASPMAESSPSVSRQTSRPASRSTLQKGGGQQHLATPSTSSYNNSSSAPLPVKTLPVKKAAPPRPANGARKKNNQGANTVGAVLTKANKLAATPTASTAAGAIRFSPEEAAQVAALTAEIENLQRENNAHSKARASELEGQRAQIFFKALSQQPAAAAAPTPPPPPKPRVSHKKQVHVQQQPASPGYMPQGTVYSTAPSDSGSHDSYASVAGPSHGGYTVSPAAPQPIQQQGRTVYKVAAASSSGVPVSGPSHAVGPLRNGGPPPQQMLLANSQQLAQSQQQQHHGQPPPQMSVMTSSSMMVMPSGAPPPMQMTTPSPQMMTGPGGRRIVGNVGSRMVVRGGPSATVSQAHQGAPLPVAQLQQQSQGLTVRAALKQGGLQHLQQQQQHLNNHQLQNQMPQQQPHLLQQQQQASHHQLHPAQTSAHHRASPMAQPSTSTSSQHHHQQQQPTPLLQLSMPVQQPQQGQQAMRIENDPFRPSPQMVAKRIEVKRLDRQKKLQGVMDKMSAQLLQPDTEEPFAGIDDIFRRLMPFHLLYEHDMDPVLEEEFDLQFMRASVAADVQKKQIENKIRRIKLKEAMAPMDEEKNLLLFLDAKWEAAQLEEEKKMDPVALRPTAESTARMLATSFPSLPPPGARLAEMQQQQEREKKSLVHLSNSLYEYHPFVERRRIPTPPPPGPLHGLEESEVEESEDEDVKPKPTAGPSSIGKSLASTHALLPSTSKMTSSGPKKEPLTSDSEDDSESASPEMGWPAHDAPPPTVTHTTHQHRPATVPERVIKQEISSPRPAAAAKVQPSRVASPARTRVVTVAAGSKHTMPEAIPMPQASRNRMAEDRQREEDRRKKVEERERRFAEERKKMEEERKRAKEERERKRKEEEEQREREEEEKRRREEEEKAKRVIQPLKIKFKMTAAKADEERRVEERKEEERRAEEVKKEEEERENRKSKKKRKKEKRSREEGGDEEEERERKRRKKERKERERQQAAAAAGAPAPVSAADVVPVPSGASTMPPEAAASTMTTPSGLRLKIKLPTPAAAATPAAASGASGVTIRPPQPPPVLPVAAPTHPSLIPNLSRAAPPVTPQQSQQPPSAAAGGSGAATLSVPRLKINLSGLKVEKQTPSPSPAKDERKEKEERREERKEKKEKRDKEERRREKEERRKENGHHHSHKEKKKDKEHRHKDHNNKEHKEHRSERHHHHREQRQEQPAAVAPPTMSPSKQQQQQQSRLTPAAPAAAAATAPQPKQAVPSVKINMASHRPQPQPQQLQQQRPSAAGAAPTLSAARAAAGAAVAAAVAPAAPPPAPVISLQQMLQRTQQQQQLQAQQQLQQQQQQMMTMMMNASKMSMAQPPPIPQPSTSSLFRPSVIATATPNATQPPMLLPAQQLLLQALAPPVVMPAPLPLLGLDRLPTMAQKSPEIQVNFSDSEEEDEARTNSLHASAAALNRMVGRAPTLLPPAQNHHHRVPPMQPVQSTPSSFPWNNQYQ